jgi:hypothetical protein
MTNLYEISQEESDKLWSNAQENMAMRIVELNQKLKTAHNVSKINQLNELLKINQTLYNFLFCKKQQTAISN